MTRGLVGDKSFDLLCRAGIYTGHVEPVPAPTQNQSCNLSLVVHIKVDPAFNGRSIKLCLALRKILHGTLISPGLQEMVAVPRYCQYGGLAHLVRTDLAIHDFGGKMDELVVF